MTRFFHSRGMGAEVLDYFCENGKDWFLTAAVRGEDLTHERYLSQPERLCDVLAERLRMLHECATKTIAQATMIARIFPIALVMPHPRKRGLFCKREAIC